MSTFTITKKNAFVSGLLVFSILFFIIGSIEKKEGYYVVAVFSLIGSLFLFFKEEILAKFKEVQKNKEVETKNNNEEPKKETITTPPVVELTEVSVVKN